jgi:hypothetical protein
VLTVSNALPWSKDDVGEFVDGYCTGYHCVRETVAWPAQIGNKWCFCKKPGIDGVIVVNDKACRCNSNYETLKRFIVKSVSVYSKVIDFIENGKDKWCFCKFPYILYVCIRRLCISSRL